MANTLGRAEVISDSYVMHNEHCNMKEAGNDDSCQLDKVLFWDLLS